MRHVTYGGKSLLMDDESADTLVEYAAAVAADGGGESVSLRAVGDDGNAVDVTFLLNAGTVLVIETASADLQAPHNPEEVRAMRDRLHLRDHPRSPPPESLVDRSAPDLDDYR